MLSYCDSILYPTLILLSYLVGSIPFAYIVTKFLISKDIRHIGSGNVGATNASRAVGPLFGVLVHLLDGVKGFVMILLAKHYSNNDIMISLVAISALIGHIFPIYLNYKGGKGSSISIFMIAALDINVFIIAVITLLLVLLVFRIVGAASVIVAIQIFCIGLKIVMMDMTTVYGYCFIVISSIVIIMHRSNIIALMHKS